MLRDLLFDSSGVIEMVGCPFFFFSGNVVHVPPCNIFDVSGETLQVVTKQNTEGTVGVTV